MAGSFRFKKRPTIIPESSTTELSASYRQDLGRRASRRAKEQRWDTLEATDEIPMRLNLLRPSLRFLRSVVDYLSIRNALEKAMPKFKTLLDRFTQKEWADLVERGMQFTTQSTAGFISRVKGRLFELNFQYSTSIADIRRRCENKVREILAPPGSNQWNPKVLVITESYSIYRGARKQFADVLFVVFDKANNPSKVWIVAVGESKSDGNAIELVTRGENPLDPGSGEFTGQLHLRTEELDNLEIELPGYGKFSRSDGTLACGTLRRGASADRPWTKPDTIYVGIIPVDTPPDIRTRIAAALQGTNSLLLNHENMTGAEATKLATTFVSYLPMLDALAK